MARQYKTFAECKAEQDAKREKNRLARAARKAEKDAAKTEAKAQTHQDAQLQEKHKTFAEYKAEKDAQRQEKDQTRATRKADKDAARAEAQAQKEAQRQEKDQARAATLGLTHTDRDVVSPSFKYLAFTLGLSVDRDRGTFTRGGSLTHPTRFPIAGCSAHLIDGDASQRFTVTRLALAGPFGLAMPKATGHRNIIIVTPEGQQLPISVSPKRTQEAVRFTSAFNSISAKLAQR